MNRISAGRRSMASDWPNNGLRHSYASYRLAQCQDAAKVALEMGNTPTMIFRHYRELVMPQDAAAWWNTFLRAGRQRGAHECTSGRKVTSRHLAKQLRDSLA